MNISPLWGFGERVFEPGCIHKVGLVYFDGARNFIDGFERPLVYFLSTSSIVICKHDFISQDTCIGIFIAELTMCHVKFMNYT